MTPPLVRFLLLLALSLTTMCTSAADSDPPTFALSAAPVGPAATVARSVAEARARLWQALAGAETNPWFLERPALGRQFDRFTLDGNDADRKGIDARLQPLLPGGGTDFSVPPSIDVLPPGTADAGLAEYIALPAAARAADLLIGHGRRSRREFWETGEYRKDGQMLPYSVDYIVHFTALTANSTRVEIYGINATVIDGTERRFAAQQDGLGLPWWRKFDKQHDVPPASSDKAAVFAQVLKLVE